MQGPHGVTFLAGVHLIPLCDKSFDFPFVFEWRFPPGVYKMLDILIKRKKTKKRESGPKDDKILSREKKNTRLN